MAAKHQSSYKLPMAATFNSSQQKVHC